MEIKKLYFNIIYIKLLLIIKKWMEYQNYSSIYKELEESVLNTKEIYKGNNHIIEVKK